MTEMITFFYIMTLRFPEGRTTTFSDTVSVEPNTSARDLYDAVWVSVKGDPYFRREFEHSPLAPSVVFYSCTPNKRV